MHVCLHTSAHSSSLHICISIPLKLPLKSYYLEQSCRDVLFWSCRVRDHSALEQEMDVLVIFFVSTSTDQSDLRTVLVCSPRQSTPCQGCCGRRGTRLLVSNQEAEGSERSSSDSFHHFMQLRTSACGMTSSTPRQTKHS